MQLLSSFREIHIENTNSCRYKCSMCPRDKHTRPLGFMSEEDFSLVLEQIQGFSGIIHLHGFGEPLLDRRLPRKIDMLKQKCPDAHLQLFSTLGVQLTSSYFKDLLEAGLQDLVVSFYGFNALDYQSIHGFDGFELARKNLELLAKEMVSYPLFRASIKVPQEGLSSSLPLVQSIEKKQFCQEMKAKGFYLIEWSYVHNYGDGRSYNLPGEMICPVINGKRRHILNITWDLNVVPCAYDFNGSLVFGNLRSQTIEEVFTSPSYFEFVLAHSSGNGDRYSICKNCEKKDYG